MSEEAELIASSGWRQGSALPQTLVRRLIDDGRAKGVVLLTENGEPLGNAAFAQRRTAGEYNARRLSFSVTVDDIDFTHGRGAKASGAS